MPLSVTGQSQVFMNSHSSAFQRWSVLTRLVLSCTMLNTNDNCMTQLLYDVEHK